MHVVDFKTKTQPRAEPPDMLATPDMVRSENDLCDRLADAMPGEIIPYYIGMLAADRAPTSLTLSDHHMDARRKIGAALDALGGHESAAGSCAWHVVGLEMSVREWAMRQGWGGRPVAPPQAQGMLVATLSVLAGHFGLVPRTRAA